MRKTILGPDVGADLDLFDGVDDVDGLPHSEAVVVDHGDYRRVFVSGTGPLDGDGTVLAPGDVAEQTRAVLETIRDLLAEADGGLRDVVRLRLYTDGMTEEEYLDVCRVRGSLLPEGHEPASTMVTTDDVGVEGMRIEADADAVVPRDGWDVSRATRE